MTKKLIKKRSKLYNSTFRDKIDNRSKRKDQSVRFICLIRRQVRNRCNFEESPSNSTLCLCQIFHLQSSKIILLDQRIHFFNNILNSLFILSKLHNFLGQWGQFNNFLIYTISRFQHFEGLTNIIMLSHDFLLTFMQYFIEIFYSSYHFLE